MNIYEAAMAAIGTEKCIARRAWNGFVKVKPTNGPGCCIAMHADGSHPSKYGWQPQENDLIEDDWILVD